MQRFHVNVIVCGRLESGGKVDSKFYAFLDKRTTPPCSTKLVVSKYCYCLVRFELAYGGMNICSGLGINKISEMPHMRKANLNSNCLLAVDMRQNP